MTALVPPDSLCETHACWGARGPKSPGSDLIWRSALDIEWGENRGNKKEGCFGISIQVAMVQSDHSKRVYACTNALKQGVGHRLFSDGPSRGRDCDSFWTAGRNAELCLTALTACYASSREHSRPETYRHRLAWIRDRVRRACRRLGYLVPILSSRGRSLTRASNIGVMKWSRHGFPGGKRCGHGTPVAMPARMQVPSNDPSTART